MADTQPTPPNLIRSTLQAVLVGELHNAGSTTPSSFVREATATALDAVWPAIEEHVLAAAVRRVGLLQTANDGTLIAASRDRILNAIANTSQEA